MAIGGDSAQYRLAATIRGMEINAVEVIARLFGRNGEARLFDQALQIRGRHGEDVAEIIDAQAREVVGRQCLQREARLAASDGEPALVSLALHLDIASLWELAHDVVEHMRRHC